LVMINMDDGAGHIKRRVFCPNPVTPALCPILALTMYMCSRDSLPGSEHDQKLFPPSMETIIMNKLREYRVFSMMLQEGLLDSRRINDASCIGGISLIYYEHNTSSTVVNAINSRLDGSKEYNPADDLLAARFLAGLPIDNTIIVGPYFSAMSATQDEDVISASRDSFKILQESQSGLRLALLACLVYHSDYIETTMGQSFISKLPVFINREKLSMLRRKVICSLEKDQKQEAANPILSSVAAATTDASSNEWITSIQNSIRVLLQRSFITVNQQTSLRFTQLNEQLQSITERCRLGSVQDCVQGWKQIHATFENMKLLSQSAISEVEMIIDQHMLEYLLVMIQRRSPAAPKTKEEHQT